MLRELKARIRKFGSNVSGAISPLLLTHSESLRVGLVETAEEMTRAGVRYSFGFTSALPSSTGQAPATAIPDGVTAGKLVQWLLWNPISNAQDNVSIIIDEIGAVLVSGALTSTDGCVLLGAKVFPAQQPTAPPTAMATGISTNPRGRAQKSGSSLIIAANQTLATAVAEFEQLATYAGSNTAILSVAAYNANVIGDIIIPPGCGYALFVTTGSATGSPTFAPVGVYREQSMPLQ